jgi:diaminopimelate decarboxylase
MKYSNIPFEKIHHTFGEALKQGFVREEDTAVIFYDLEYLKERLEYLKSVFPSSTLHGIAIKANPLFRILEMMKEMDLGIEAASIGEVSFSLKAGFSPGKIVYDSPVKTVRELETAMEAGIHINTDSISEIERIALLKKKMSTKSTFGVRINPQVGTGSILESSVAGEYSKFGVPIKTGRSALLDAFSKHEWLTGVHLHVGSQGCPVELLLNGIGVVFDFVSEVNKKHGKQQITVFDIGGGLPVSYDRRHTPVSMEDYGKQIKLRFPELFTEKFILITEFGRWANVNAGWTISRVEYVKRDPGINTLMIHTGADLFVRECLNPTSWQHEYTLLDRNGIPKSGKLDTPYNLAGPLCFSGDILAKNIHLPVAEEGDYLIIHDTGGYTFSMWSHYNSRQSPRIVGYHRDGKVFEILKERGSLEEVGGFWE